MTSVVYYRSIHLGEHVGRGHSAGGKLQLQGEQNTIDHGIQLLRGPVVRLRPSGSITAQ